MNCVIDNYRSEDPATRVFDLAHTIVIQRINSRAFKKNGWEDLATHLEERTVRRLEEFRTELRLWNQQE